ncbi:MAG: biopolymer transporter ExbD [Proteobacteria bacterium]|nr:biopolymer transporter ExbD [Pseudomonadota bacterium]
MRFERAPRPRRRPGLTSLVDVVFLLLIFFMLVTQLEREALLTLEVGAPPSESASAPEATAADEILLRADGGARIAARPVAAGALAQALRDWAREAPAREVRLATEPDVSVQQIVSALDALRAGGVRSVQLVAAGGVEG